MSTRAQVRFATREKGQSFSEHPNAIHAQFYVHSDGFPDGLGVDLAESLIDNKKIRMEIESLTARHGDLEYIYYIWQGLRPVVCAVRIWLRLLSIYLYTIYIYLYIYYIYTYILYIYLYIYYIYTIYILIYYIYTYIYTIYGRV